MDRRTFLLLITASTVWKSSSVDAAQLPARIVFLSPADKPGPNHRAFVDQLARLGWVEGKTLHIEWRWLGQHYETLPGQPSKRERRHCA
jgi:hypothetical protein